MALTVLMLTTLLLDYWPRNAYATSFHIITWEFYTYAEPDFRAERIGRFAPQSVNILSRNAGGWGLIRTSQGEGWVYLNSNRRFIERRVSIFTNIGDETPISHISPQVVRILERDGDWILIDTWLGDKWLYLNFTPPTYHFDALLQRFGNNISVYFENIETGHVYTFNPDTVYFSASVPKAIFALYIYLKAERGEVDLDSLVTYTRADFHGGSGVIRRRYSTGTELTQRELLRLNLSYSDNIATNMLRRVHGTEGYRQFVASIGGNPDLVSDGVFTSHITLNDAAIFARAIFDYVESDGRYSAEFRDHLLNNQYPFIVSDYPVASKTGWTRPIAWHDMAIVYAPSPYILIILSRRNGWSAQDYRDFAEISTAFQIFNDFWF